MESKEKERDVFALERQKEELETHIGELVREYETDHVGPFELDLSFVEGEGSGPSPEELRSRMQAVVEAFHRRPLIRDSGIRVHKVTAIDSDADGRVAVRVHYDYPEYVDEE